MGLHSGKDHDSSMEPGSEKHSTLNAAISAYARVLGFRVLGFRVLGFQVLGFRVLGF